MPQLEKMIVEMEVVESLRGINKDIWGGLGKVHTTPDGQTRLTTTLSFDFSVHSCDKEVLYKKVYGKYSVGGGITLGNDPPSSTTMVGWHHEVVGFKAKSIKRSDRQTFIKVALQRNLSYENRYSLSIEDNHIGYDFWRRSIHKDRIHKADVFEIDSLGTGYKGILTANFNLRGDALTWANKFLLTVFTADCRERIRLQLLPQNFSHLQNRTLAEAQGNVGKTFKMDYWGKV